MKAITKKIVISGVPARWKLQYPNLDIEPGPLFSARNGHKINKTKRQVYEELCALDKETATDKNVEDIIGNGSWTTMTCDECKQDTDTLIQLGGEPDYESRTACICPACLTKASSLI